MTLDYESFLISKRASVNPSGFDQVLSTNPKLFAWQADIVRWALKISKAALFADCGLGKSFMQLEWAYHVHDHTKGDVLILAPLSVGNQTKKEGIKLGIDVNICRTQADVKSYAYARTKGIHERAFVRSGVYRRMERQDR